MQREREIAALKNGSRSERMDVCDVIWVLRMGAEVAELLIISSNCCSGREKGNWFGFHIGLGSLFMPQCFSCPHLRVVQLK